jgi:hypothetical protein
MMHGVTLEHLRTVGVDIETSRHWAWMRGLPVIIGWEIVGQ